MHLSRLLLNPRCRQVRRDLSDVREIHRTVMSAFPRAGTGEPRAELGVLFRAEPGGRDGRTALIVQSGDAPDWSALPSDYLTDPNAQSKPIGEAYGRLGNGQHLRFRLRANVTKKVDTKSRPDGKRRNGRRIEVRDEARQIAWLKRRAEAAGFRLVPAGVNSNVPEVRVVQEARLTGGPRAANQQKTMKKDHRITVRPVLFEGMLQITDVERFRLALATGIGPGKAYGCGLLSIAPINSAS